MKVKNPIGPKVSLGHGYYYQRITLSGMKGYVKIWYHGEVVDRCMSVSKAREKIKRWLQEGMLRGTE